MKYNQLCVLQATTLGDGDERELIKDFEGFFADKGFRIKFATETTTQGSIEKNEEGGRKDILFYIHDDDILKFSPWRLQLGIRWWEDVVVYNDGAYMYSDEILKQYTPKW